MNTEQGMALLRDVDAIRRGLIHLQGGPQNWTTKSYAHTVFNGHAVYGTQEVFGLALSNPASPCGTCMLGAGFFGRFLQAPEAYGGSYSTEALMERAFRRLGSRGNIPSFNDEEGRTYAEALVMYEAIYHNILDHHGIPRDWYKEDEPCSA